MKQLEVHELSYAEINQSKIPWNASYIFQSLKINREEVKDYVLSDHVLLLNQSLKQGDVIEVSYLTNLPSNYDVISPGKANRPNSWIKKYGTTKRLKHNQSYTGSIVVQEEAISFDFVSSLSPMFSTVRKIREDLGEFAEGFTDEYIASVLHGNSLELIDIIKESEDSPVTITYDETEETYELSSKLINQWVQYKTDLDFIYAKYYGISANYGSQTKIIGEIEITKSVKLPYLDTLLNRFKRKFDEIDATIRGGIVSSVGAVKAGANFVYRERPTF